MTCSRTRSDLYWSSTTIVGGDGTNARAEYFYGRSYIDTKFFAAYVRAVRGGF